VLSKEDFKKWTEREGEMAHSPSPGMAATEPAQNPDKPKVEFASVRGHTYTSLDGDMFENWKQMQEPATNEDAALINHGRDIFREKGCISCHMIRGHEGVGQVGPELTHVGSRTTIAAGILDNTPENLKQWVMHPDQVKPGNGMFYGRSMPGYMMRTDPNVNEWTPFIKVSDTEADALVAYLHSLR
jgi:cytochrome c oxidase subunit 2